MRIASLMLVFASLGCTPLAAPAQEWDMLENYIATLYASADDCRASMPDEVARGLAELRAALEAEGNDIEAIQATSLYQKFYVKALASKRARSNEERQSGCKWDWGSFREDKAEPSMDEQRT